MHIAGLFGMPRRVYTYPSDMGWGIYNLLSTCGAAVLTLGVVAVGVNVVLSLIRGREAGADPWGGNTLEWTVPSPPPAYNFAVIPTVTHRDQLWWDKYGDEHGAHVSNDDLPTTAEVQQRANAQHPHVHLPNPSYFPFTAALGFFIAGLGILFRDPAITLGLLHLPIFAVVGMALMIISIYAWAFEPAG
jgi:hypothetical protein